MNLVLKHLVPYGRLVVPSNTVYKYDYIQNKDILIYFDDPKLIPTSDLEDARTLSVNFIYDSLAGKYIEDIGNRIYSFNDKEGGFISFHVLPYEEEELLDFTLAEKRIRITRQIFNETILSLDIQVKEDNLKYCSKYFI